LDFSGLGYVSNDADGGAFGLGIELIDELVDAGFIRGDIIDADKVAFASKAAGNGLASKGRESVSTCTNSNGPYLKVLLFVRGYSHATAGASHNSRALWHSGYDIGVTCESLTGCESLIAYEGIRLPLFGPTESHTEQET
jgi:hypothetical protein